MRPAFRRVVTTLSHPRSGPTYYTYVGGNWEKDKEVFMDGNKCHSEACGTSRTYFEYSGRYSGGFSLETRDGEPAHISTQRVFQDFSEWLTKNVLQKVESVAEATHVETTAEPEIPYPQDVGPFYISIDRQTYKRICAGKANRESTGSIFLTPKRLLDGAFL